jgi:hypothetical protein
LELKKGKKHWILETDPIAREKLLEELVSQFLFSMMNTKTIWKKH